MDMMMEPLLLFETVLLEDRPVLDFIDANYTYRSARLRKWLGGGNREAKSAGRFPCNSLGNLCPTGAREA